LVKVEDTGINIPVSIFCLLNHHGEPYHK